MTLQGDYVPSPNAWVREQVELYESTGGVEGSTLRGVPVVIITSVGARSGKVRKTPVMRVEHEGRYAAVASQGGDPKHPTWYFNLLANPRIEVQDGPEPRPFVAREVGGAEKATWWQRARAVWPAYADYQQRTEREIPVFVLEPVTD
ncbi:MAG: nitroreductase family deazaflavin-dependent oxidoreductase [Nocardioidaceae bacterium]